MGETYALGTFSEGARDSWPGVVRDGLVKPLAELVPNAPSELGDVFAQWGNWSQAIHDTVSASDPAGWRREAELVAHLPFRPGSLLGAGANYRQHVIELIVDTGAGGSANLSREERIAFATKTMDERAANGKPLIWVAFPGGISGPDQPLVIPYDMTQPDWELELAVVMGKAARRVDRSEALGYVAGYTIANDITARELVWRPDSDKLGMDWFACKSAPGFHILGPYITPARFVPDPQVLHIRLSLNDQTMQDEGTSDMIFNVARLIEFASAYVELQPGDVIMTGSPAGNGTHYNRFLRDGDQMVGEIDGLVGRQTVRCLAESAAAAAAAKSSNGGG